MRRQSLILLGLPLVFSAGPAAAAGYGLKESSADALAASYAGSAATGTDATYLAYNPASLAAVKGTDYALSLVGIFPSSDASYSVANNALTAPISGTRKPSDFVEDAIVPTLAFRTRLDENWTAGLVVHAPWGLSTVYPASWAGRYHALESKLLTIDTIPTIAYQITPDVALGAGIQIQYAKGILSNAVDIGTLGLLNAIPGGGDGRAKITADDWGFGFMLGATANITPDTTLGISYRSQVEHTLKGTLKFTLDNEGVGAIIRGATGALANTPATADITTPDVVSAGLRAKLSDEWTGLLEVDWTDWSDFKELRIDSKNPAQPDDVTTAHWNDTWFGSIGAEYHPAGQWIFKAGFGYDQSPVPNHTRNPRIPDADRVWLSGGVGFKAGENIGVNLSYSHLFIGEETVNLTTALNGNALRGNLRGETNSEVDTVALELTYTP